MSKKNWRPLAALLMVAALLGAVAGLMAFTYLRNAPGASVVVSQSIQNSTIVLRGVIPYQVSGHVVIFYDHTGFLVASALTDNSGVATVSLIPPMGTGPYHASYR